MPHAADPVRDVSQRRDLSPLHCRHTAHGRNPTRGVGISAPFTRQQDKRVLQKIKVNGQTYNPTAQ